MMPDDDSPAGVPQWILTYGDMMALLLTFFIMLVSMSEIKQNDKFQGVADSLHEQFGYNAAAYRHAPGELRPRSASLAAVALAGRAQRREQMAGGIHVTANRAGDSDLRIAQSTSRTSIGTAIHFGDADTALSPAAQGELQRVSRLFAGKSQKIEVCGYCSQRPANAGQSMPDPWDLALQRARATMRFLIDDLKIPPQRIRMSVAGPDEPVNLNAGLARTHNGQRVEVYLLEEVPGEQRAASPETVPSTPEPAPRT
jgi:chemotaxis protein MotB